MKMESRDNHPYYATLSVGVIEQKGCIFGLFSKRNIIKNMNNSLLQV